MNAIQKSLITATIPILKSNGNALITYFYERMFKHNPELKNIFNMSNQANGKQQNALTGAVLAYAEHIENPSVLINVLKSIGNKHVSLNISAEQYEIIGNHLINSIKEVLGDAATNDITDAWACAYNELASIMIGIEAEMYEENKNKKGGWNGWRNFEICKIIEENDEVKSFYLTPQDKKEIAEFAPGQYITVKTFIPELGFEQPRQYSLSTAFNDSYYRISVKKEKGNIQNPDGIFSNTLHNKQIGELLEVSAPAGVFCINTEEKNPLVLISGGIGATPLMSMLETNKNLLDKNKTVWIHGCRNENVHTFKKDLEKLNSESEWLTSFVFYETKSLEREDVLEGFINLEKIKESVIMNDAKYYICGPEIFIKSQYKSLLSLGVERSQILYEEFGPQLLNLN
jgi:nitric oxide dioxygenase